MISTIISAVIGGLIIGALARLVLPGKQNISVLMTILLGVLGSFIGSWLIYTLFNYGNRGGGIAWIPFLAGVLVAALLIALYSAMTGRRTVSGRRDIV